MLDFESGASLKWWRLKRKLKNMSSSVQQGQSREISDTERRAWWFDECVDGTGRGEECSWIRSQLIKN